MCYFVLSLDNKHAISASSPKTGAVFLCFDQNNSGIDYLHVHNHLLGAFVADTHGGTADLIDNIALQTALRIHSLDSLHHSAQAVGAEQIYIQIAPGFEVI